MVDVNTLADQLVNLTIKEVSELASVLKEKYGIKLPYQITSVE